MGEQQQQQEEDQLILLLRLQHGGSGVGGGRDANLEYLSKPAGREELFKWYARLIECHRFLNVLESISNGERAGNVAEALLLSLIHI